MERKKMKEKLTELKGTVDTFKETTIHTLQEFQNRERKGKRLFEENNS